MLMRARAIASLALGLTLAALATTASAQVVKPWKINGGGPAPEGISLIPGVPVYQEAYGNGTGLGTYSGTGHFTLLGFTGDLTAEFSSAPTFTFTAANGDKLVVTYGDTGNDADEPGQITLTPHPDGSFSARFVAEFNPLVSECTGRFAKLTGGSLIMIAESTPFFFDFANLRTTPFFYTWEGQGVLVYARGK